MLLFCRWIYSFFGKGKPKQDRQLNTSLPPSDTQRQQHLTWYMPLTPPTTTLLPDEAAGSTVPNAAPPPDAASAAWALYGGGGGRERGTPGS